MDKISTLLSLWWGNFARLISVTAIILFLLSNVFHPEVWVVGQTRAEYEDVSPTSQSSPAGDPSPTPTPTPSSTPTPTPTATETPAATNVPSVDCLGSLKVNGQDNPEGSLLNIGSTNSVTLSWEGTTTTYNLRVVDETAAQEYPQNDISAKSVTINVISGHTYRWWVETPASDGCNVMGMQGRRFIIGTASGGESIGSGEGGNAAVGVLAVFAGPTVSSPSCIPSNYNGNGITIAWSNSSVQWLDIDTDSSFTGSFYHKYVANSNSTRGDGFTESFNGQTLTYNPNTTYYIRAFDGIEYSAIGSFSISACSDGGGSNIAAPTVSAPSCILNGYSGSGITFGWSNSNVNWVDISTDSSFNSSFYHKYVLGSNSTTGDGFAEAFFGGTLTFNPNTNYYVRTFNQSQYSLVASFNISACVNTRAVLSLDKKVLLSGSYIDDIGQSSAFAPGAAVPYRIVVTNTSSLTANNVTVTDNLPTYINNLATVQDGTVANGQVTFYIGDLGSGQSRTFHFQPLVSSTPPTGYTSQNNVAVATSTNADTVSNTANVWVYLASVLGDPALFITKTTETPLTNVSGIARFTINVRNDSGRDVTGVDVFDDLPPEFRYVNNTTVGSITANPTISPSGQMLTWSGINILNGQTISFTFQTTVAPTAAVYTNQARTSVGGLSWGPVPAVVTVEANVLVPNIGINTVVVDANNNEHENISAATRFKVGDLVKFRIKLTNSIASAANVVVVNTLPEWLEVATVGSGAIVSGRQITWNVGNLAPSVSQNLELTATVRSGIPAGETVQPNTATVAAANMQPRSDTASIWVYRAPEGGEPVLTVTMTPPSQSANINENVSFRIEVKNTTGRVVNSIEVIDNLPPGFSYVAGFTTGSTTSNPAISGQTLTWSGINLANDQTWAVNFRIKVSGTASTNFNLATVKAENKLFGPASATIIVGGGASSGGTGQSQTQNNNQSQNNNQTVSITLAGQPAVARLSGIKELPRTGLPLLAWGITAFLPLGARLRRFGLRGKFNKIDHTPHFIAEKRKYYK